MFVERFIRTKESPRKSKTSSTDDWKPMERKCPADNPPPFPDLEGRSNKMREGGYPGVKNADSASQWKGVVWLSDLHFCISSQLSICSIFSSFYLIWKLKSTNNIFFRSFSIFICFVFFFFPSDILQISFLISFLVFQFSSISVF